MTSPNVLSAIIRASRPTFRCEPTHLVSEVTREDGEEAAPRQVILSFGRSREDRLAYAVHAFLLSDGYKLVAAGRDADEAAAGA